jgi:hypothetical protein
VVGRLAQTTAGRHHDRDESLDLLVEPVAPADAQILGQPVLPLGAEVGLNLVGRRHVVPHREIEAQPQRVRAERARRIRLLAIDLGVAMR